MKSIILAEEPKLRKRVCDYALKRSLQYSNLCNCDKDPYNRMARMLFDNFIQTFNVQYRFRQSNKT